MLLRVSANRTVPLDINFEVQHRVSSSMTFLRGAIAEPFTRPGVELRRCPISEVLRQVFQAVLALWAGTGE